PRVIDADFDMRAVERSMAALERRARDARPLYQELKPAVRADQRDHGRRQQGPGGRWARHDPDTRSRRPRRRRVLGRLPPAVQYSAQPDGVTARSRVRWSAIHQDGGTAGKGARIPARPFLWFSPQFLADARRA